MSFIVSENNSKYSSNNGLLLSKDGRNLIQGINGDVIIPDGVTSIGNSAFSGCSGLTSVTIPNSVTSIVKSAFSGCKPTSVTVPGYKCEIDFSSVTNLVISEGTDNIASDAFSGCSGLKSVTIGNSVTSIGEWAFYGCSGLTSVTIGDSVTSIGDYAFYGCSGLADVQGFVIVRGVLYDYFGEDGNIVIPDSVTSIESQAFYGCRGLMSVTIPDSVTSIELQAFYGCSGLTSVTIGDSVTSIGDYAFYGCGKNYLFLGNAPVGGSSPLPSGSVITVFDNAAGFGASPWNGYTIDRLDSAEYVTSADGKLVLGNGSDSALSSIYTGAKYMIRDGVDEIAANAFYGCSNLVEITVPASVKSIGANAFGECVNLRRVRYLGDKPEGIDIYASKEGVLVDVTSVVTDGTLGWSEEGSNELPELWQDRPIEYSPIPVASGTVKSGTVWKSGRIYRVAGNITVASGATLTIQPGAIVKFDSGVSLTVNSGGTLNAIGTRAQPIVFTSIKDDEYGGDTNEDGDRTYAQPGDWARIYAGGTLNMNYCTIRHCNNNSDNGAIHGTGGTVKFDNGIIELSVYECVRMNSGKFISYNSVFRDSSMGFGYFGGSGVYVYNGVVADCTIACRASNKHFYNTVFYNCQTFLESTSSSCNNCLFYNEYSFGAQSATQVGKNGNIWGDPLFVDPENGDFRISAGSPCVDAGNGDFASETDYYGQPRMDVKKIKDTGIANAEGVCPDVGIYEVPGTAAVPLPDLAVVSVSAPAEAVSGEPITVTYVVTNRGKAILTGTVRDIVRFRGVDVALGGQVVAAEAVSQTYSLSVGGACAEVSATVNVPALKPGNWVVSVMVNAERDIYEGVLVNNTADALGETRISSLSFEAGGIQTVSVASHSTAVTAVNGLPATGGAIVAMLPAGVSFYAAVGYVPSIGQSDVIGTALADGRTALFLSPHQADELVYVTLVNESGEKVDVQLEALISSEGLEVSKPSDVEITENGPNVTASLILPSSIRDGRIYAAYVEYSNTGDKDADMPIFTIRRTSGNAKFSASSKGAFSAEALNLVGLAPSVPRGKLKPGESGRITFYILTSGTLGVSLDMVTEKSTSVLNGFESISAYCAGMSSAATRLCARDGVEPGFTEILAQALNEKRGAGGAAVSGTLRHLITRMPLSDYMIALTATNDNSIVSAVKTDKNGAFSLSTSEVGDYAITIIGVQNYETPIYSLIDTDVNGETIYAVPHSSLSGMAYIDDSLEPAARVKVTLDNVATEKIEDYVVETLDDGRYVFNGIVDGDYILSAYPVQSWCMVTSTVFTVTNGVSYTKNICYTEKGIKVSGTVTDIDTGLSVTNVLVALTLEDGSDPIGATSDGDGNFEIEGLPAGKYTLAVASDRYVLDGLPTVDISGESDITLPVSVRTKPVFSVMRPVGMVSHTTAFALLGSVSSPEWDFDGDGIVDSRELQPTYTYSVAGKYDVKLSYVDDKGVRRTCIAADGVEVLDKFENKLTSNGVVLTAGCGVTVENVSTNSLVLVGSIAGNYKVGTVIGMESGTHGGFIRKIISIRSVSGNRYEFEVEPASLDDLFDEYFYSTDFSFTEAQVAYALRASMAKVMTKSATAPTGNRHDIDIGVTIDKFDPVTITIGGEGMSLTHYSDPVAGSQICYKRNGKKVEVYSVKNSYVAKIPISVAVELASREKKLKKAKRLFNWNGCANGPAFWGPWGLYFSIDCDYGIEGSVTAEGSISGEFSLTALSVNEIRREDDKKETNKVIDRSFSDAGFSIKSLNGTLSVEADAYVIVGVYASWLKAIGRIGGGVKVGMTFGAEQDLAYDFGENILDGEFSSTFRLTSSLYGTIAGSASLLRVRDAKKLAGEIPWRLEWQGNAELGKIGFTTSGDDLTVNFGCKNPEMEAAGFLLGWLDGFEIGTTGQVWSFGDMSFGAGANTSHRYAQEGEYTVRMGAVCAFPSGFLSLSPFAKTTSAKVRVYDDRPPEPQEPTDQGRQNPKQSCDPNEMNGPEGVGEQRFVKPGDWMTYTVYFENKAEADVPAQEVYVTNPLSPYLDWSTFEMMDAAFGNRVESGLTGKKNGTITVVQNGTEDQVQINVALDQTKGEAKWYLRSWSPNRSDYNYWPEDGAGFLPPNNPETHCGEGHLTYRIKLRDDAPSGLVITNSATIVFDYNEPITTDPAWWNTVAPETIAAKMSPEATKANEGDNLTFKVFGGNLTKRSSVQVQLAYNTASAADIDLKNGTVDSSTGGSPVPNAQAARSTILKFPLTITWAPGEIGEKTITIPVKTDKVVEADEFFTLQLALPKNMALGDDDICTVAIHDPGYDELKAKVDGGAAMAKEITQWNKLHPGKVYVRPLATPATGGKVSGGAAVVPGKTARLRASALSGYVFAGWYTNAMCAAGQELVGYGDYRNPSLAYLADELDVDIFARFIPVEEDYLTLGDDFLPSEITTNAQVSIYVPVESASLPDIKVSGLPSGIKFYAKETVVKATKTTPAYTIAANTIYGIAPKRATTGPATVTVTVKNAGKYAITRKYQLSIIEGEAGGDSAEVVSDALKFYSLAVDLSDDFAGKVTGPGVYQAGKKVTVKATANKGYVFNGWYMGEELLTQAASYSFTMPETDVALYAKFVTAEEDAASIALSVDALGGEISPEAIISVTNMCGVALKWSVATEALSQPKVTVSGLPAGLKFTAKDIMKKGSKTEVEIPANTVYGAPTAESKLDAKTGLRKPSAVKVTVTTAGKSKRIYPVDMTILPLPDWAVGTFNGGGDLGQVSLTVAKTGKLSGKYLSDGLTWSLAANSFDSIDESGEVYRATLIGKSGKLAMTNEVGVACDSMGGFAESIDYIAYQNNWKLEPWKTIGKPFAKAAALEYEDSASVAGVPVPGVLALKFAASGAVTVKGSFVTGVNERTGKDILYTASGSAVLAPQSEPDETGVFDAVVFVYLPPKTGKFDGYVRCIGVRWTGEDWVKQ